MMLTTASLVGDWIQGGLYKLLLLLDSLVYTLISWFYQVFNVLASCQLFTSDIYEGLAQRIYIIVGIVTLFMLSYQLLLLVINPDESKNFGDGKKIVINVVTSLAMILLVPTAFDVMFRFQNAVIQSDTLSELILSNVDDDSMINCNNSDSSLGCYGNKMAVDTFQAFFYPTNASVDDIEAGTSASQISAEYGDGTITLDEAYDIATTEGSFSVFSAFSDNVVDGEISYTWLISTIMGGIMAYILFVYCLDLGLRAIKLAFYEIIAPLPIIVRVIPSQTKIFSSWVKATLSTYAEVFIRIAVLYFAVFAFTYVPSIMASAFNQYTDNTVIFLLVKAILILGIIIFIRKFPELLSEITGIKSGNFSASFMDRIKEAAFIPAAAGALVTSRGNPFAAIRAGRAAWRDKDLRSIGAEARRRAEYKELRKQGMKPWEIYKYRKQKQLREMLGFDSPYEAEMRKIENETETFQNSTRSKIVLLRDENGKELLAIDSGKAIQIDNATIEKLEAEKLENVQKMNDDKNEIASLQKSADYGKLVASIAGNVKDEAEKKIDEKGSKETYTLYRKQRVVDPQTGSVTWVDDTSDPFFTGTFQQISDRIDKMTDEERAKYNLAEIRSKMIENFIASQSKVPSLVSKELESGFQTIINNGGYSCKVYKKDAAGNVMRDANGSAIVESREYVVEKNANGEYEAYFIDGSNNKIYVTDDSGRKKSGYDLADALKNLSKESGNILALEMQEIQQKKIDPREKQNSDIDTVLKTVKDLKEAKKNSQKMQTLKKADGYIASSKPPEKKK